MDSLNNKNIWIIGASSGIGASLAKKLAEEGANLILSARREDKLQKVLDSLNGNGHKVYQLDVTDSKKVEKTAKAIKASFEKIDCVIFMAATYAPSSNKGEMSIEVITSSVNVNFIGALNVSHYCIPIFRGQGEGLLALCGSIAGYRGLPNGQPYCATKAAIINLSESLYMENKDYGVDVKLISPGFVETPLTEKNNFSMPFIIKSDEAAESIVKGLKSRSFEIHFPKIFTYMLKFLQILPNWIYLKIAKNVR